MNTVKFNRLFRKFNTDTKAFEQIYAEFYPQIVLHLKRCFQSKISAEDIVQDLFCKLLSYEKFGYIQHPAAWLNKLAENMAVDELRRQHINLELDVNLYSRFDLDELIANKETRQYLKTLDETSQKILYMHYWEGYSFKEIALELNLNYNTIRTKVFKSYKKLKKTINNFN